MLGLYKFCCALVCISLVGAVPYGDSKKVLNTIKTIVIFGDSFSDTKNVYTLTNKTYPPSYYYDGHYSNGRMWPEYLQEVTSWKVINYAYGGATVNNKVIQGYAGINNDIPVPSIADQIETHRKYLNTYPKETSPSSTLYVIEPAGNDYFYGGPTTTPVSVATNIYETSKALFEPPFSGVYLLYFNVALDHLPYNMNQNVTIRNGAKADRIKHNQALDSLVLNNNKARTKVFDLNGFLVKELAKPSKVDPEIACTQSPSTPDGKPVICSNPEKKAFWDIFHPTTVTHQTMAHAILNTISG